MSQYDDLLNAPDTAAPDVAQSDNEYLNMLDESERQQKQAVAGQLSTAVKVNPDQYSTQRRVASYLGYPVAAVEANPQLKEQAQVQQVQQDTATRPVLQRKYTDADFAKLAHDDSGSLAALADFFVASAKYITSSPDKPQDKTLMGDIAAGARRADAGAAGLMRAVSEFLAVPFDFMEADTPEQAAGWRGSVGGNPLRRLAEGFGMIGAYDERRAKELSPDSGNLVTDSISSGVQSLTQNTLLLPLALLPGGEPAVLYGMAGTTGGQSYEKAREAGADQWTALGYGASDAVIEYATEKIPLGKLIGDLKANSSITKMLAHQIATEIPGEQVATIFQDLNEWAVLHPEQTFGDYLRERPSAAAQTLIATLIGVGGNVAVTHTLARVAQQADGSARAEDAAKAFGDLTKLVEATKLAERSPEEMRSLLHELSGEANVRIDAATLMEAFNQSQLDIGQVFPTLNQEELKLAAVSGGEVSVPVADMITNTRGTPLEGSLVEHLRFGDNELSAAEAKQVREQLKDKFKKDFEESLAGANDAEAIRQSIENVRQTLLEQLNTAGRHSAQVNEAMSHWAAAFYSTMSQRLGMTPEEMYARYPLRVTGEATGQGSTLNDSGNRPGALTVEGYHYSKAPRQVLSGGAYGTGLKGSGYETYANAADKRLAKRVYFYADKGTGINPEPGVGGHAHRATLTNVYDANTDPLRLRKGSQTDFESALLDAGYSGYLDRLSGTQSAQVIMLGDQSIKPEYMGQLAKTTGAVVPGEGKRASLGRDQVVDAINDNKNLPSGSPTRARWSQLLEKVSPAEHAALKAAGVFDGNQDEALFKSELVKEFERKTEAPVYEQGPTSDAGHKRESNGRYVGAPDWVGKSPQQLAVLRKKLEKLTVEGQVGRYWYEKSARAVLDMVGGDKAAAEKFIGLLAIYSPGTNVSVNTTSALKAWYQWKAGEPITAGRFPTAMGKKAEAWLNRGEDWGGIKTNNFYTDLMEEIDPSKVDEHHSTMDMWMALAFDYGDKKLDQGPKYLFAQREIKRIADNMGWRPHQVQAAIWTSIKARVEGSEKERNAYEDKKGIRIANPEGGHEIAKGREYDHYRAATRFGMESKITQADIDASDYDFSDALQERTAQVSWEATPGASTGVLPGIHEAPMFQQEEYLAAIRKALADENGRDLIDARLGLMTTTGDQLYSGWQGQTSVGVQQRAGVTVENGRVSGQSRLRVQLAADIRGLVLSQEGMAWHFPVYNGAKFGQNGSEFTLGRTLTAEETSALYASLSAELGHSYAPPIPTVDGFRVLNFPDEKFALEGETDKGKIKELQKASREKNDAFHEAVLRAVGAQAFNQEISNVTRFETDGELRENNWANGDADYRKRIGDAAARLDNNGGAQASDLLKWVDDDLRPRVEAVNKDFAERYGWDNPHPEQFTGRAAGSGGRLADGQTRVDVDGVQRPALNSNDRPIAAAEEGVRNFWRWFGGSKVVDENGKPLVVYHGSTRGGIRNATVQHSFFTSSEEVARTYSEDDYTGSKGDSPIVQGVYLRMLNPLIVDANGEEWMRLQFEGNRYTTDELAREAKRRGHDGLIVANVVDNVANEDLPPSNIYVTLGKQSQIKSAIDNNGAFDPKNPNILAQGPRGTFNPQTETPEFKAWFGDSKAVTRVNAETGRPVVSSKEASRVVPEVMYHTTRNSFDAFETGRTTKNSSTFGDWETTRHAFFVTPDVEASQAYGTTGGKFAAGANVVPLYVRAENPLDLTGGYIPSDIEQKFSDVGFNTRWLWNFDWSKFDDEEGADFVATVKQLGYDAVIFNDENPDTGESFEAWALFSPEQVKSTIGNNGAFDPTNPNLLAQGPRGRFNPKSLELVLSPTADLSTWFHETGHFYLEVLADIAGQPNAPAQIADDVNKILAWFGVKDLATWRAMSLDEKRRYHERFAESIEQYVMEGKAPSVELRPFFRRFRAWLMSVYKSLQSFLASKPDSAQTPLNDDIRRVMDRMLATDEQIQQANEIAGMVPDETADAEAAERLQRRSMADLKWDVTARDKVIKKLRREAKSIEKDIRAKVTEEVNQMPEVLAKQALDKAQAEHDASPVAADMNTATIADAFGYPSTDAMYKAIEQFGNKQDVIDALTERRMLEDHGELVDDHAIEAAANEAVHNEARARSLATELRTQREMLNPRQDTGRVASNGAKVTVNALVEAAKQFGNNVADNTVLKDLKAKVWQHTQAERRAARAWQEATAGGKTEEAVKAKQNQLLNNAAAKAVIDAKNEAAKAFEFFKRVVKGNDEKVVDKGRDPDIVNAARAVLAAYGVETPTTKAAAEYLETVSKNDPETYNTIRPMVEGALQMAQPLESLTVEQLRSLHEEIQSLWFLAKRSRQMEVDGDLMDIEDAAAQLHERMEKIGIPDKVPGEESALTDADKRKRWLQFAGALLRRVEQWSEKMDGKFGGPFLRLVFQPVKDAAEHYRSDRVAYRKAFTDLVDKVAPSFTHKLIEAPELGYTFGKGHNGIGHAELMHAILHTGNESNLRKLLLGRNWGELTPDGKLDTTRWSAFITRLAKEGVLTREHFDFAQGVWDLLEKTKPQAQKAHRDVFGRYFNEVTATPFVDPFGVERAGGYLPAQADPMIVNDADLRSLAEIENENMAFAFPATNKGFTKSRVEYNRPLKLDLRTIPQHLDKVLLFSHMEPAVRGVAKLLRNKGVSQALNRIDPSAYSGMLLPWLNRSARQMVETPIAGDGGASRLLSTLRSRAGAALMFANISNSVQQLTGFLSAGVKVDSGHMMRAAAQMVAHPKQMIEAVKAQSEFMRNRMEGEIAHMTDLVNDIVLNHSLYEKAQAWSLRNTYFLQQAIDNTTGPIIWTAAYNQGLADGLSEKEAVRFADGTIRQTQQATSPEDVSRIETGPAYARIFTQFAGYFNMLANTNATALQQIASEMGLKKGAGKALGVVFFGVLAPIWVAEAIAQAFMGGPDDKDHDGYLDDWLAAVFGMGTIKGLLAYVPFVGQLANAGINKFNSNPNDDRVSLSPTVGLLESSVGVPADVYNAINGKLNAKKTIEDVASLVNVVTGLPTRALARPVGYVAGVEQDKIQPTSAADAVRGVATGAASPASRQR